MILKLFWLGWCMCGLHHYIFCALNSSLPQVLDAFYLKFVRSGLVSHWESFKWEVFNNTPDSRGEMEHWWNGYSCFLQTVSRNRLQYHVVVVVGLFCDAKIEISIIPFHPNTCLPSRSNNTHIHNTFSLVCLYYAHLGLVTKCISNFYTVLHPFLPWLKASHKA